MALAEEARETMKAFASADEQMSKVVIGQKKVIQRLFVALLAGGHVLVEGVPGIAKTLMIRTLSSVSGCDFKRIQFTPDLLPSDIIGLSSYSREKGFYITMGPVFANFILADEVNRAPPKVQSALLEAMQERQVTLGQKSYALPRPFFVMATQNPLEQQGTYALPQVQLDRFLFKLFVSYPSVEEETRVLKTNISTSRFEDFGIRPVLKPARIAELQKDALEVAVSDNLKDYIVSLVDATRNPKDYGLRNARYIEWGASPRASISLYIASRALALTRGASEATAQDVREIALDCLRHRIVLNYEAQAEGIKTDSIVQEMLSKVK